MNDLVVVEQKPMELSVQEVKNQVQKIQNLMGDLMKEGEHYGASFPGDTKKNLLKPGADKLMFMFRLRADFHQDIKELPGGHREVLSRCEIHHIESGQKIAEGVGSASTMESKYRWRNAAKKCPVCGKETIIKGKDEYGGGWVCFGKKGGCGAKFENGDPAIEEQVTGKIENPDIADTYNTVIKISKKRAYVDATITACAASDIFTQDLDDLPEADEKKPVNKNEEKSPANQASEPDHPENKRLFNKRKELGEKLLSIMTAKDPDELDYFTDQEKQLVKNILQKTGYRPQGIAIMEGLIEKWEQELKEREKSFSPVDF
jgi:hypothetical protein